MLFSFSLYKCFLLLFISLFNLFYAQLLFTVGGVFCGGRAVERCIVGAQEESVQGDGGGG